LTHRRPPIVAEGEEMSGTSPADAGSAGAKGEESRMGETRG
jgi:hypothetical protein